MSISSSSQRCFLPKKSCPIIQTNKRRMAKVMAVNLFLSVLTASESITCHQRHSYSSSVQDGTPNEEERRAVELREWMSEWSHHFPFTSIGYDALPWPLLLSRPSLHLFFIAGSFITSSRFCRRRDGAVRSIRRTLYLDFFPKRRLPSMPKPARAEARPGISETS